jgi:hypothetical protein
MRQLHSRFSRFARARPHIQKARLVAGPREVVFSSALAFAALLAVALSLAFAVNVALLALAALLLLLTLLSALTALLVLAVTVILVLILVSHCWFLSSVAPVNDGTSFTFLDQT